MNFRKLNGRGQQALANQGEDLRWTQMYESSRIEQQSFHGERDYISASTMSKLVRVTSTSSSNGMGADRPKRMASTKASAQAACPLSWRQRFSLLKPGHP